MASERFLLGNFGSSVRPEGDEVVASICLMPFTGWDDTRRHLRLYGPAEIRRLRDWLNGALETAERLAADESADA